MSKEPGTTRISRREALAGVVGGAAAGVLSLTGLGCVGRSKDGQPNQGVRFRVQDAGGAYRRIGRTIGAENRDRIRDALHGQPIFETCSEAARGPLEGRVGRYLEAARDRFPHLIEELEGMAAGAGIPFSQLFAWNCRSEILAELGAADTCTPGCSTVALAREGEFTLAQNEDGAGAYLGRMFVVRVSPPSGVAFACLVYPGSVPGNGPGLNSRGVVQTTNYLSPCEAADGVPRYFLGRAILEAEALDEAVEIATAEGRAFPWHHNLGSLDEGRLLSVETWPGRHSAIEVDGLYLHTNHLVHPEMQGLPENAEYVARSSISRYERLRELLDEGGTREGTELVEALNDHSSEPCRVCRHPGDPVPGVTLARAVFESPGKRMTLVEGPPCTGRSELFTP